MVINYNDVEEKSNLKIQKILKKSSKTIKNDIIDCKENYMKKSKFLVLLMTMMLLIPSFVYAEEEQVESSTYEKIKATISSISTRIKNYIEECREKRETEIVETTTNEEKEINLEGSFEVEKKINNLGIKIDATTEIKGENNEGIRKDSNGSIKTDIIATITTKDKNSDEKNVLASEYAGNLLSYCIKDQKLSFEKTSVNGLGTSIKTKKESLLGFLSEAIENKFEIGHTDNFKFEIEKNNSDNEKSFELNIGDNNNNYLSYYSKKLKKIFGIEKETTKNFKFEDNLDYSASLKFSLKKEDNIVVDPEKEEKKEPSEEEDTTKDSVVSTITNSLATNLSNPLTKDNIEKDIIILFVSTISLIVTTMIGKKKIFNE